MPISTTSLNYNFASLEASRAASIARGDDAAADQLRNSLSSQLGQLEPGTTITARYQYKVGADGTLTPTETQITTEANDPSSVTQNDDTQQQRSRQTLSQQSGGRRQNLADISKPRAQLSPSDELALFASSTSTANASGTSASTAGNLLPVQGEAVASDGTKIDVEILAPGAQSVSAGNQSGAQILSLAAQAQSSVAALYARNNDIVYNVSPLAELAA